MQQALAAYCLVVKGAAGTWQLLAGGGSRVLANGTLPAPFNSTAPHALTLSMHGTAIVAAVDGAELATVSDSQYTRGMAGLGGGYHEHEWGSFSVAA
jgi:hypothetical protein